VRYWVGQYSYQEQVFYQYSEVITLMGASQLVAGAAALLVIASSI
jgi:hypothetical protein